MPTSDTPYLPNRRALLHGAILFVGGVAVAPGVLAASGRTFFAVPERSQLNLLCETMIPRTDTPGAIDAGVPAFLDTLMADWASPAHQKLMRDTIARLSSAARVDAGKSLGELTAPERIAWLTKQDTALLAAGDPGYRQFKQLVLTGYYYSEAGATQELRYELVPGVWEPGVPVTADTRTWAA